MRRKFMTSPSEDENSYWVIFDESQSTTVLERGGNVEVRDAIRSKFRRCMAMPQANGKAAIAYLNENDSTKWPDGSTVSEINTNRGGKYVMVHFPKYYYRNEDLGNDRYKLYVSQSKLNSKHKEERECLIAVFEGYVDNGKLVSWNGLSIAADFMTTFYRGARGNGSKWGLIDYRAHKTIANMFCVMYGNTDISTLNPDIPCSGGTRLYNDRVGGAIYLGNKDGRSAAPNSNYYSTNFLGVEDCYGGKEEFVQGINIIDREWIVYDGGLSVDKTADQLIAEGFTNVRTIGTAASNSHAGFITKIKHGEYADVMPVTVGNDVDATYYPDHYWSNTGNKVLLRSGSSIDGSKSGVFYSNVYRDYSQSYSTSGTRLGFYGTIEVKTKDEWLALTPDYTG